jgi:hypothetical protein
MNKLIRTAVITVVIVAGAWHVGRAQEPSAARPDFSGKWVFASSQPSGGLGNALGDKFSITQDAATLRIDTTAFRVSDSRTVSLFETRFPIRTIYSLDGIEHPSQVSTDASPTFRVEMMSIIEESISKATWAGRQLVIMTYSRMKTTVPSRTPSNVRRRTERQALSTEADGTLVVESLIVVDPLPGADEAPSPTPLRSIYKKG